MEKFSCKNLGIDCDFEVIGATKEEVLEKAMEHGGVVHADLMVGMTEEQSAEFAQQLAASIETI